MSKKRKIFWSLIVIFIIIPGYFLVFLTSGYSPNAHMAKNYKPKINEEVYKKQLNGDLSVNNTLLWAEKGNPVAMYSVSFRRYADFKDKISEAKADEYLLRSAEAGYYYAQEDLGGRYIYMEMELGIKRKITKRGFIGQKGQHVIIHLRHKSMHGWGIFILTRLRHKKKMTLWS